MDPTLEPIPAFLLWILKHDPTFFPTLIRTLEDTAESLTPNDAWFKVLANQLRFIREAHADGRTAELSKHIQLVSACTDDYFVATLEEASARFGTEPTPEVRAMMQQYLDERKLALQTEVQA